MRFVSLLLTWLLIVATSSLPARAEGSAPYGQRHTLTDLSASLKTVALLVDVDEIQSPQRLEPGLVDPLQGDGSGDPLLVTASQLLVQARSAQPLRMRLPDLFFPDKPAYARQIPRAPPYLTL